jgi:hypothetical protein
MIHDGHQQASSVDRDEASWDGARTKESNDTPFLVSGKPGSVLNPVVLRGIGVSNGNDVRVKSI